MVPAFFDQDKVINSADIVKVLREFLQQPKKKRSDLTLGSDPLRWDIAPVHSAKLVEDYLA
jgi:hypothetical protein